MLHVILFILKILGILLLVLVVLFLLVLYAVLFVAVSYQIQAEKKETGQVSAFASWLFRIVTVRFWLKEEEDFSPRFQLRLFGFPLWKIPGEERPKKRSEKPAKKKRGRKKRKCPKKKETQSSMSSPMEPPPDFLQAGADEERLQKPAERQPDPKEVPPAFEEERLNEKKKPPKRPLFERLGQKIKGVFQRLCHKIRRIWEKIKQIGRTIRRLRDRKNDFLTFWNLEEHRRARGALLKEVKYLWKKSRPRKIKGQILFGFSDPAHTGLCMGAAGMLCAWYPKTLRIQPDFEQEILKGEIFIKGKIRCYVFVRILLRVYFHKDIRHMYRQWQQF